MEYGGVGGNSQRVAACRGGGGVSILEASAVLRGGEIVFSGPSPKVVRLVRMPSWADRYTRAS